MQMCLYCRTGGSDRCHRPNHTWVANLQAGDALCRRPDRVTDLEPITVVKDIDDALAAGADRRRRVDDLDPAARHEVVYHERRSLRVAREPSHDMPERGTEPIEISERAVLAALRRRCRRRGGTRRPRHPLRSTRPRTRHELRTVRHLHSET